MNIRHTFSLNSERHADIEEFLKDRDVSAAVRAGLRLLMGQPSLSDVLNEVRQIADNLSNVQTRPVENEENHELSNALDNLLFGDSQ